MELSNQVIYGKMSWMTLNFPKSLVMHLKQELEPINFAVNFVLVSIMHKILVSLSWKLNYEVGRQKFACRNAINKRQLLYFFTVPHVTAGTNLHGCVATVIDAVLKAPKLIVVFAFELSFVMVNVVVLPAKCFYQWLSFSFFWWLFLLGNSWTHKVPNLPAFIFLLTQAFRSSSLVVSNKIFSLYFVTIVQTCLLSLRSLVSLFPLCPEVAYNFLVFLFWEFFSRLLKLTSTCMYAVMPSI